MTEPKKAGYWRIEQMLEQLGGYKMNGSLIYIGNQRIVYNCRDDDSYPDPLKWSDSEHSEYPWLNWEIGVMLFPNFGENSHIHFIVALDADDTYGFFAMRGPHLLMELRGLYAEDIAGVVEREYDDIIRSEFGGWIPIS